MLKPTVKGFFDTTTATWTYVVWAEGHEDRRCAIIDSVLGFDIHSGRTYTGPADVVAEFVRARGLAVQWILETHVHADHLTGSARLRGALGGTSAISRHILAVLATWRPILCNGGDTPGDGSQFDHLFDDDEAFAIGPLAARIIHTPGHTPADTSYIVGDAVFVGDAMFLPDVGTGRCDFPGGSAADSYDSARKLLALPESTRMFVGHDYPTGGRKPACMATVAEQRRGNIRVRDGVDRAAYVAKRNADDVGKAVPALLLPSIQVNLRNGTFGAADGGVRFVRIPVDTI